MVEFKPLNLAQLYQGADAAVGQAMQMNLMAMQASRMKQDFDEEDQLRVLARNNTKTDPTTGAIGMDLRSFTKGAYGINPMKAIGFEKAAADAEKSALERTKLQGEVDKQRRDAAEKRLELMGNASSAPFLEYQKLVDSGVADPEARKRVQPLYIQGVQNLVSSGLFTQEQLSKFDLKPEFDPAIAKVGMDQVVGAKGALEEFWRSKGFGETQRHNKATEGQAAGTAAETARHNKVAEAMQKAGLDQAQWSYDAERGLAINKITQETKPLKVEGGGALPPKTGDVEGLRKEFNNREEVKNYNTAVPVLRAVANAPDTSAGDLDFIYGVGKILDPGSVVREGEMALVMKSGTPLQRILGSTRFNAEQGGRITPAQRAQLLDALQGRVDELHKAATDARKPFEAQAKRQNIPIEETLTLPDLPKLGSKGKAKPAGQGPAVGHVEDGWRFKGGDASKPENWEKSS